MYSKFASCLVVFMDSIPLRNAEVVGRRAVSEQSVHIIPSPRLNQTNRFKSEAAQTYMKYVRKAESRKIYLDHLKMGFGIST